MFFTGNYWYVSQKFLTENWHSAENAVPENLRYAMKCDPFSYKKSCATMHTNQTISKAPSRCASRRSALFSGCFPPKIGFSEYRQLAAMIKREQFNAWFAFSRYTAKKYPAKVKKRIESITVWFDKIDFIFMINTCCCYREYSCTTRTFADYFPNGLFSSQMTGRTSHDSQTAIASTTNNKFLLYSRRETGFAIDPDSVIL